MQQYRPVAAEGSLPGMTLEAYFQAQEVTRRPKKWRRRREVLLGSSELGYVVNNHGDRKSPPS